MRKLFVLVAGVVASLTFLVPVGAQAAPSTHSGRVSLHIDKYTSALYPSDQSVDNTGPLVTTVTAYAQLKNCPEGFYQQNWTFVQDGVSYPAATGPGMGAGELPCNQYQPNPQEVGFAFYGNGLLPGKATFSVQIYDPTAGTVLIEKTRTVRIPGHRCHRDHTGALATPSE